MRYKRSRIMDSSLERLKRLKRRSQPLAVQGKAVPQLAATGYDLSGITAPGLLKYKQLRGPKICHENVQFANTTASPRSTVL